MHANRLLTRTSRNPRASGARVGHWPVAVAICSLERIVPRYLHESTTGIELAFRSKEGGSRNLTSISTR
jgi:hypothetical protein